MSSCQPLACPHVFAHTCVQMLESEGLHKYVDPRYLRHELAEATGLSEAEMDAAAHQLMMQQQQQQSNGLGLRASPANPQRPDEHYAPQHRRQYDDSLR